MNQLTYKWSQLITKLNTKWHEQALLLFLLLIIGHFSEHLVQIYQIYMMGWLPSEAGGILGLRFPFLATSESLHIFYNGLTWLGVILLRQGLKGHGRIWWKITIIFASWHLFEHILLQYQYLSSNFWFGRTVQTSIGEIWFTRPELHFVYNLLVVIPMAIAYAYHFYHQARYELPAATAALKQVSPSAKPTVQQRKSVPKQPQANIQ